MSKSDIDFTDLLGSFRVILAVDPPPPPPPPPQADKTLSYSISSHMDLSLLLSIFSKHYLSDWPLKRCVASICMFPKPHTCAGCVFLALCLFSVNALLPLEAPPVPGWPLFGQILVGGFRSRRAGSCGCEIVRQALLSQVRVAAGVLLDGGHPRSPCAVRGGAAARAWGRDTAAGYGGGPAPALLLRLVGQRGGRGPAAVGEGRLRRLDDAHGR